MVVMTPLWHPLWLLVRVKACPRSSVLRCPRTLSPPCSFIWLQSSVM